MSPAVRQESADFIRECFETSGLSQHQLARMLGVRHQTVSRWLSGQRCPDEPTIRALCRALHVPVEIFLRRMEVAKSRQDVRI